jgi:hypothetical protein
MKIEITDTEGFKTLYSWTKLPIIKSDLSIVFLKSDDDDARHKST